jgi:predicted  nucleic acid-binding Zn-ribbon protein
MTEGLITRIGRWLDNKWEAKATERKVEEMCSNLNFQQIQIRVELLDKIRDTVKGLLSEIEATNSQIKSLKATYNGSNTDKELSDLKTRIERIELNAGMTRRVDPTKPPLVKSAFEM